MIFFKQEAEKDVDAISSEIDCLISLFFPGCSMLDITDYTWRTGETVSFVITSLE
jgi:hypothetical protein